LNEILCVKCVSLSGFWVLIGGGGGWYYLICTTLPRREGGFESVLGENRGLRIEVSRWYSCLVYRRSVMVLPQVKDLAAERGCFDGGLGGNWVVKIEVSH
jgi:hypothetical protein